MRQPSLWSNKEELERTELWDGLPQAVRAEFVERLVRIVVESAMRPKGLEDRGGRDGLEGSAKPPRP